jgi:hypothetical protein
MPIDLLRLFIIHVAVPSALFVRARLHTSRRWPAIQALNKPCDAALLTCTTRPVHAGDSPRRLHSTIPLTQLNLCCRQNQHHHQHGSWTHETIDCGQRYLQYLQVLRALKSDCVDVIFC